MRSSWKYHLMFICHLHATNRCDIMYVAGQGLLRFNHFMQLATSCANK